MCGMHFSHCRQDHSQTVSTMKGRHDDHTRKTGSAQVPGWRVTNHLTVHVSCAHSESIKKYFIKATAINSHSLYGHHNNKHQLQMRWVKIKEEQTTGSNIYNRRGKRIHHFVEPALHSCIMLQCINHSYPVSSCIYHNRPGCSGSLAQEDDQTRRSKQYPLHAAGGWERILRRRWTTFRWVILLVGVVSLLHLLL